MKKSFVFAFFVLCFGMTTLSGCQRIKVSEPQSVNCSSLNSNGVSYFDSASLCSQVPGNSNCVAVVVETGGSPRTCYSHSGSTSGGENPSPANIAFVSANGAIAFGNVSSTNVISKRVEVKNNGASVAGACTVTMGRSIFLAISGQIPGSIPAGQTVAFTLSTVISSPAPTSGTNFSTTFDISCSNSNRISGTANGTFGSSTGGSSTDAVDSGSLQR